MERLRRWSPGSLFREVPGSREDLILQYPSRPEAAGYFLIMAGGLLGGAFGITATLPSDLEDGLIVGALSVVVAIPGTLGLGRLFCQRVLRISRAKRTLVFLKRTPLGTRREAFAFADLNLILVSDRGAPGTAHPERQFEVFGVTADQTRLFLGRDLREAAINHARRLSDLIGIPLQLPTLVP